jgi:hypothetical protein
MRAANRAKNPYCVLSIPADFPHFFQSEIKSSLPGFVIPLIFKSGDQR